MVTTGRWTTGGAVSWWVWVLLAWGVLAVGVGVVVGRGIRTAERRELGHDSGDEATREDDEEA